ncbi:MAG TPA: hypothetical protein GXX39_02280 [Syntrophothermus lipocalidus]|nr:hypothetical protein [Syntrophothermus lipocalidus]
MAIHYVTVTAAREKDHRGREVLRTISCVPGTTVPDMTTDNYYDNLAKVFLPGILRFLTDMRTTRKEHEVS